MRARPSNKLKVKPTATPAIFGVWLLSAILLSACMKGNESSCMSGIEHPCIPEEGPHMQLAEYGLFKGDIRDLEPIDGLVPYDLNTPLFSDYAEKSRFLYVPDDSAIAFTPENELNYPVGSTLIKNFYYYRDKQNESAGRILVETRLMIRKHYGWTANTYVWDEEQKEAVLLQVGGSKQLSWVDREGQKRMVKYQIPSINDCKTCHSLNNAMVLLGPKVRNLNKEYLYQDKVKNQLSYWNQIGILQDHPNPDSLSRLPAWDLSSTGTLNERARAYLDVNCGMCHNPGGSANNSRLYLNLENENAFNLGIYKRPLAPGPGSGGLEYDIVPGNPDSSIVVYRMEAIEPQVRMPELGRTLVHDEAVRLIREWIENMDGMD